MLRHRFAPCLAFAVAACGGQSAATTVSVPVLPIASASAPPPPVPVADPQPPPPSDLAGFVLDASRAALDAARGEAVDVRFQCDDASRDIRATSDDTRKALAELGDGARMVLAGVETLVFTAPTANGHVEFRSDLAVWPDGRVRFGDARSRVETTPVGDDALPVDALPPELRAMAQEIVEGLTHDCALSPISREDVATLGLPEELQEKAGRRVGEDAEKLRGACRDAQSASGPWRVSAERVIAMIRSDTGLQLLRAPLVLESGQHHLCLGPVTSETVDAPRRPPRHPPPPARP